MLASLWWGDVATFKVQLSCQLLHFDGGMLRLSKLIFHDAALTLSNIYIHDSSADASIDSSWFYSEQSSTVFQESFSILSFYGCMFPQCVLIRKQHCSTQNYSATTCLWFHLSSIYSELFLVEWAMQSRTCTLTDCVILYMMVHDDFILLWLWFFQFYLQLHISQTVCPLCDDGFRVFFWRIVFHSYSQIYIFF